MSYFSKEAELRAYKTLSGISEDPTAQGATQKVSALRYVIALDMFYHKYGRKCNTRDYQDKTEYAELVGKVVAVDALHHTTNFYTPLADSKGDYNVGSNFYSVNVVKDSLVAPSLSVVFPRRGGHPLMDIRNGELIRNANYYPNIDYFIGNDYSLKTALIVWLLRNSDYNYSNSTSVKNALTTLLTQDLINTLISPATFATDIQPYLDFKPYKPNFSEEDIANLFSATNKGYIPKKFPLQQIYFGAPGTGKSHAIKVLTEPYCDTTIRTTFHPDSDYSSFVGCYKPTMQYVEQTYIVEGEQKPVLNAKTQEKAYKQEIVYAYTPQAFLQAYMMAWQRLQDGTPVFLIIEEINRGNCAQIFGDLFQLLDRDKDSGYSEYPIRADRDMQTCLQAAFAEHTDLPETIRTGRELQLPPNLHIWATMNTSDQSLFPIDSAFKRRWQWRYCPIVNMPDLHYRIQAGGQTFDWWQVIEHINQAIEDTTKSEDKKLGYFFVQDDGGGIISVETFVNKVVFYLWNDVFKDAYSNTLFTDGLTFYRFFCPDGEIDMNVVVQFLEHIVGNEA